MIQLIKSLSDRPIAFHRAYVRLTGSINAALMLSQAMYWTIRVDEEKEGWFYKTSAEWERETGMGRREQDTARKQLKSTGFWEEKLKGVPATTHYRIDLEKMASSLAESAKPVFTKQPKRDGGKRQTILYSTENTAENTISESKDSVSHKSVLSEEQQLSIELPNTAARAKKVYPEFVKLWRTAFPALGFNDVSGKKIKEMILTSFEIVKEREAKYGNENNLTEEDRAVGLFQYLLDYARRTNNWAYGKSITTFEGKYREIYNEKESGKSKPAKQSTRDFINSL